MPGPKPTPTPPEAPRTAFLRRLVGVGLVAGSVVVAVRLASPEAPAPSGEAASRPEPHTRRLPVSAAQQNDGPAPAQREEPAPSPRGPAGNGGPAPLDLDRPPEAEPPGLTETARLEWYVGRLATARRDLAAQRRARARMPELREKAETSSNPDVALREWEAAVERLEENIARSEEKIRWYEAKLRSLGVDPAEP